MQPHFHGVTWHIGSLRIWCCYCKTTKHLFNGSKRLSAIRGFVLFVSQVRWMSDANIDARSSVHTEALGHLFIPKEASRRFFYHFVKLCESSFKSNVKLSRNDVVLWWQYVRNALQFHYKSNPTNQTNGKQTKNGVEIRHPNGADVRDVRCGFTKTRSKCIPIFLNTWSLTISNMERYTHHFNPP